MNPGDVPHLRKAWDDNRDVLMGYMLTHSLRLTPAQEKLITVSKAHEMNFLLSSPDELQLLQNIVRMIQARKTLDIGVFTGYSAMSIALALPDDGQVVGLETNEEFIAFGKPYWIGAGVEHKIDVRIAPAIDTLQSLVENGESGTFDFAFIDADKQNYKNYYEYCLKLLRPGGVIVVDNVFWGHTVLDETNTNKYAACIREFNKFVASDQRVHISMVDIGDGITIAIKK